MPIISEFIASSIITFCPPTFSSSCSPLVCPRASELTRRARLLCLFLLRSTASALVCKALLGMSSTGDTVPSATPPRCWLYLGAAARAVQCLRGRCSGSLASPDQGFSLVVFSVLRGQTHKAAEGWVDTVRSLAQTLSQEQGTHCRRPSPAVRSCRAEGQRWGAHLFLLPGDALRDGAGHLAPPPVSVDHRTRNCPGTQVWVPYKEVSRATA